MKIEPVINSQISLLKKRNLGLAKLADAYAYGQSGNGDSWDYEIRENSTTLIEFVNLLKDARDLDEASTEAAEEESEGQETDMGLPPLLPRGAAMP